MLMVAVAILSQGKLLITISLIYYDVIAKIHGQYPNDPFHLAVCLKVEGCAHLERCLEPCREMLPKAPCEIGISM